MVVVGLLNLSDKVLRRILGFLTYQEVTPVRAVCRRLRDAGTKVLNDAFWGLRPRVQQQLAAVEQKLTVSEGLQAASLLLRRKNLLILQSELAVLHVICGQHVARGCCCFFAGSILDCCDDILGPADQVEFELTVRLFLAVEEFLDYFEETFETDVVKSEDNRLGTKIINLMDCCSSSSFYLLATYTNEAFHIGGFYRINATWSMEVPPVGSLSNGHKLSNQEIRSLLRYVRYSVRWSNLGYMIQHPSEIDWSGRRQERRRRRRLSQKKRRIVPPAEALKGTGDGLDSCGDVYQQVFTRSHSKDRSGRIGYGMTVTVELQSSRPGAPVRLKSPMDRAPLSPRNKLSPANMVVGGKPLSGNYDFNLEMSVRCVDRRGDSVETTMNLYQTEPGAVFSRSSRTVLPASWRPVIKNGSQTPASPRC